MSWLKFEASLPEKPETLAITAAMGWDDPDLTVGKLMRLFRWFDQQTTDGNARGVTLALLDRLIGVAGFSQSVADAGWLVVTEAGLTLHNFDRHNGETAKGRALTAKRVAKHRSNAPANGEANAAGVTSPLAREEKSREEEKKIDPPSAAPSPVKAKKVKTQLREDFAVSDAVKAWALKAGFDRLDEHLDAFKRKAAANGYAYVNWDAAFMEAVREDWAKLRTTRNGSPAPAGHTVPSRAADDTARYLAERREQEQHATLPPAALLAKVRGAVKTEAA